MAIIYLIPKMKCPFKLRNYRPINILCAISKTLEGIAADQIKEYLEKIISLIHISQHTG